MEPNNPPEEQKEIPQKKEEVPQEQVPKGSYKSYDNTPYLLMKDLYTINRII